MSFLGSQSQFNSSPYMGSGMGMGGGYSSYGGMGMGSSGLYGNQMMSGGFGMQQQNDPNNPNNQQNMMNNQGQPEYQFDLRRDIRDTIGGLNASLGLAYGVSQMANLGALGVKFLFKALKWIFRKIFNTNNIVAPIKFLMKLILGKDLLQSNREAQVRIQSLEYLESLWATQNNNPNPRGPRLPRKIFGMSVNLFKSLVLAAFGVAIQLTLFLLKRGKSKRLEEIEKEEEAERKRILEEEWKASQIEADPELVLLRDLDDAQLVDTTGFSTINQINAYDGELNSMTFNCVKNSKAFQQKLEIEEDLSWLGQSTIDQSSIQISDAESLIKSEDGWQKRRALSNAKNSFFSVNNSALNSTINQ
eukprot:403376088